ITTPIPVAPILVSPAAGAFVTTSTPTFTWNAAPYGYQYEIQIGKSYTFSLSSIVAGGKLDPGALTFTSPSLNDGTYYWRVKAWNNNTTPEAGKWSAYRIVKIDTVNPADPVLKSPADNAVLLTTRPALSVTALPAGAKYIRFQVDDANDFATPLVDVSPAAAAYTFTAAQALPFGNYYWRVCSVDAAGNQSNWSATRSFLVTILKTPADQSTITDKTPLFTWAAATGATGYQIQVADTDTFDSPLIYNIYSAAVSYAPVNALPDGVLYWRMMVTTATGGSNWTTPFKFTITP
ncbi:MAG: hypothetical protein LLG42_09305, partial [Chloroflexi bacterium]|nr:hypothetical protein [Chloroflexota bacterium]